MMATTDRNQGATVAGEIRRLTSSDKNRRFLRTMPLFGLEPTIPDTMLALLERIDQAEQEKTKSRHS